MSIQELRKCDHCQSFYNEGERHTCDHKDIAACRRRLEAFLGTHTHTG